MSASSATGKGNGSVKTKTTDQLASLINAPSILFAGSSDILDSGTSSPPSHVATVILPYILTGSSDNYVVIITPVNVETVYITSLNEDEDGNFSGFSVNGSGEGSIMYIVTKKGQRPSL